MGSESDFHKKVIGQIMQTIESDPAHVGTAQVATIKAAIKRDLKMFREEELRAFDKVCESVGIKVPRHQQQEGGLGGCG